MRRPGPAWLLLPLLLAACGDEQPLEVGGELLPPDALRSFEVVLEPGQFLLRDTAFAIYGDVPDVDYQVLANQFEGALNAHAFARFVLPTIIAVTDTLGVASADSTPTLYRGEVVLYVDSLAENDTAGDFHVAMHSLGESWDPAEADWEFRSSGVRWTTPGGTAGALLDTALVNPDSIVLQVDSATMQEWADTTNARRGALLLLLDAPSRIRTQAPVLKVYARSRFHPDTTFMVVSQAPDTRFDYRPRLPTVSGDIRIAGLPAWRSFLEFRPDLKDVTVSCGTGCSVPLRAASITRAELVLQPVTPPAGFTPERPLLPAAYRALLAPEFPLQRSPIGAAIGTMESELPPSRFSDGAAPGYLIVTDFIQQVVADTATTGSGSRNWLTLLPINASTLGVGTFAPSPRLRLVLSTAREIQLP